MAEDSPPSCHERDTAMNLRTRAAVITALALACSSGAALADEDSTAPPPALRDDAKADAPKLDNTDPALERSRERMSEQSEAAGDAVAEVAEQKAEKAEEAAAEKAEEAAESAERDAAEEVLEKAVNLDPPRD
jgi:hypothetical protein